MESLAVDLASTALYLADKEVYDSMWVEEVNKAIREIEYKLVPYAIENKWLTEAGEPIPASDIDNEGRNIFSSNLDALYEKHVNYDRAKLTVRNINDTTPVKLVLSPEQSKRFSDTYSSSFTKQLNQIHKILRVTYTDPIIEGYINRLLYAYFDIPDMIHLLKTDGLDEFAPSFLNGYWLIYALQTSFTKLHYFKDF